MRRRSTILPLVLSAAVAAGALTGCAGSGGPAEGGAAATAQQDTAGALTEEEFVDELTAAMVEAGTVSFDVDGTHVVQTIAADSFAARLTDDTGEEFYVGDGAVYVAAGESMRGYVDGDWIKADPSDPNDPMTAYMGEEFAALATLRTTLDVRFVVQVADGAMTDFEVGDIEDHNGVEVRRYEVTMDLTGFKADTLGDPAAEDIPDVQTVTYLVDEDNLLHAALNPDDADVEYTWGGQDPVTLPTEDQLVDTEMLVAWLEFYGALNDIPTP
ncbi:hypothetical protein [Cellulomonas sp.]|uniref:hypothetical protein n=1 Tax=Cellulomonas sp. TaxID=40001 RepID=UPI002811EBEA|nr:hypothetical protein [Cellulomonas sp.]